MIENMIGYILPCLINMVTVFYVATSILGKKVKLKNYKTYVGILLLLIFGIFNYFFINNFVRFFTLSIFITVIMIYVYKTDIKRTFISVVMEQTLMLVSEIIFTLITIIVLNINVEYLIMEIKGAIMTNIGISLICVILSNLNIVKSNIKKFITIFENIPTKFVYTLILFAVFTMNVVLILFYSEISVTSLFIINTVFIVCYTIIVIVALNEKSENVKYKEQNKMLIDNLNEYEKMLDYQRVNNHENKNQLLVIQGMIDKTNTKALEYLDEVIKEKREDDEGIYTSASIIPQGGLQGLVYQKMLKMKENNITINLKVERKVRKINLDNLPSKTNYDLCRAVGIIIDNAIEENLNLKEREILICMYILDEYFVIEVSNKCSVIPDMTRLDEKGYTTKSNGHGYGLSLLKEIVDSNKNIINERSINKDIFTQIIKIKK